MSFAGFVKAGVAIAMAVPLVHAAPTHASKVATAPPQASDSGTADTAPAAPAIMVLGKRLPAAEAPKWSICFYLNQNPAYSLMFRNAAASPDLLPLIYQPTRMPRNPDYSAPPKVPIGSPLPTLPKNRFGMTTGGVLALFNSDPSLASESTREADRLGANSNDKGLTSCFAALRERNPEDWMPGRRARSFQTIAADYARRDTSLPMGFALFEQGRFAEAVPYFRYAAKMLTYDNGGDEAELFTGKLLIAGFGPRRDPAEGIEWLKRAASSNFTPRLHTPVFDPDKPELNTAVGEAAMMLADIYRRGLYGEKVDMAQACRWYARAGFVGHIAAYKALGDVYYLGLGVPRDVRKAYDYYRRAARWDLTTAQVALAGILERGDDGVAADMPTAIAWYRRALGRDNADAAYALALAYDTGNGVKADPEAAFTLYRRAALKGSAPARVAIGTFYETGRVVPRDEASARRWFQLAARDGDPDGMFGYAALLANGRGGDRDLPQAWTWLRQAAARGNDEAAAAVASVEARMTPAERISAQAAVQTR